MNLFGNALKYTSRGFIIVSLSQAASPREQAEVGVECVTLSTADSGKGIGEEYLKGQLFAPFTQEDHLASGVGLGLSLVEADRKHAGWQDKRGESGSTWHDGSCVPATAAIPPGSFGERYACGNRVYRACPRAEGFGPFAWLDFRRR